jgi:hypothetical protein
VQAVFREGEAAASGTAAAAAAESGALEALGKQIERLHKKVWVGGVGGKGWNGRSVQSAL